MTGPAARPTPFLAVSRSTAAGSGGARRSGRGEASSWAGTRSAAALSSRNSVCCRPCAPAAGNLHRARARQRQPDGPGFLGSRGDDPDLPRRADGREGQRQPGRRRLRRPVHGHDGPLLLIQGRLTGEQRRDVALRADAEQQDVEGRHLAVVLGWAAARSVRAYRSAAASGSSPSGPSGPGIG